MSGETTRQTPLALKLAQRIAHDGPISVADYIDACLQDPEHGYYRRQGAIGAAADFVRSGRCAGRDGALRGGALRRDGAMRLPA